MLTSLFPLGNGTNILDLKKKTKKGTKGNIKVLWVYIQTLKKYPFSLMLSEMSYTPMEHCNGFLTS